MHASKKRRGNIKIVTSFENSKEQGEASELKRKTRSSSFQSQIQPVVLPQIRLRSGRVLSQPPEVRKKRVKRETTFVFDDKAQGQNVQPIPGPQSTELVADSLVLHSNFRVSQVGKEVHDTYISADEPVSSASSCFDSIQTQDKDHGLVNSDLSKEQSKTPTGRISIRLPTWSRSAIVPPQIHDPSFSSQAISGLERNSDNFSPHKGDKDVYFDDNDKTPVNNGRALVTSWEDQLVQSKVPRLVDHQSPTLSKRSLRGSATRIPGTASPSVPHRGGRNSHLELVSTEEDREKGETPFILTPPSIFHLRLSKTWTPELPTDVESFEEDTEEDSEFEEDESVHVAVAPRPENTTMPQMVSVMTDEDAFELPIRNNDYFDEDEGVEIFPFLAASKKPDLEWCTIHPPEKGKQRAIADNSLPSECDHPTIAEFVALRDASLPDTTLAELLSRTAFEAVFLKFQALDNVIDEMKILLRSDVDDDELDVEFNCLEQEFYLIQRRLNDVLNSESDRLASGQGTSNDPCLGNDQTIETEENKSEDEASDEFQDNIESLSTIEEEPELRDESNEPEMITGLSNQMQVHVDTVKDEDYKNPWWLNVLWKLRNMPVDMVYPSRKERKREERARERRLRRQRGEKIDSDDEEMGRQEYWDIDSAYSSPGFVDKSSSIEEYWRREIHKMAGYKLQVVDRRKYPIDWISYEDDGYNPNVAPPPQSSQPADMTPVPYCYQISDYHGRHWLQNFDVDYLKRLEDRIKGLSPVLRAYKRGNGKYVNWWINSQVEREESQRKKRREARRDNLFGTHPE